MATKVIMPQLGESVVEGTVSQWLKKEGDKVDRYEPILEIETDKVTTEATAEVAGTLLKIYVGEGETVPAGTLLAYIGEPGEELPDAPDQEEAPEATQAPPEAKKEKAPPPAGDKKAPAEDKKAYTGRISPVVARIAAEHDVDLSDVTGTGRDGRITKKDILAYVEGREKETPAPAAQPEELDPWDIPPDSGGDLFRPTDAIFAKASESMRRPETAPQPAAEGEAEILPLTGMRRAIAEHMVVSKHTSPHVTTIFEVDFTAAAAHRAANKERFARDGAKLTFTAYIVMATIEALKAHPLVNSSFSDEGIVLKREINVGVAVAIEEGLIVPVIKNADSMSLLGVARAVNDLASRARNKQLTPEEVQGGTFTITNHGVSGSLFATPIINQPQCGILGVGMIEKRVKVINDAIAIRPMAYLGLTFDHRILDGASADGFMQTIKETLESWNVSVQT